MGAFFLVPPHLQIRQIAPSLPATSELRALLERDDRPVAIGYVNTSSQQTATGLLGHTVVFVEWADGRLFMIDAAMDRDAAADFGELMQSLGDAETARVHGSIAELAPDAVEAVAGVGFTHLHIDHTQGVGAFCAARNARASRAEATRPLLYQTTWQNGAHNLHTREGAALVADSCLEARVLDGEGLVEVPGFPGLALVALGGHTPGSTAFVVALENRLFVFSGDTTNRKSDITTDTGKGFVYSYLIVPEDTERTRQLRRWLAALDRNDDIDVVVSHDLAELEAGALPRWPGSAASD